ncbi:unnamed protein product [Paramecium pentaurelia]|uniref:Uncharacterized protein n=1 Tax=Paramecium pentaurelia TaxID=43138 RepID=A0A8S1UDL3_9CILI|nr:unnamed protein product [Paramecium pentaurelia]
MVIVDMLCESVFLLMVIASGSRDESIHLWDVKTGQQKAKLYGTSGIFSVCFSPDGNTLASGSDDESIRLWDVKTNLYQPLIQIYFNILLVSNIC